MTGSELTGLVFLALLLAAWVAVQRAWRRSFADVCDDPDALAGRLGCHGSCERTVCPRRRSRGVDAGGEERA